MHLIIAQNCCLVTVFFMCIHRPTYKHISRVLFLCALKCFCPLVLFHYSLLLPPLKSKKIILRFRICTILRPRDYFGEDVFFYIGGRRFLKTMSNGIHRKSHLKRIHTGRQHFPMIFSPRPKHENSSNFSHSFACTLSRLPPHSPPNPITRKFVQQRHGATRRTNAGTHDLNFQRG